MGKIYTYLNDKIVYPELNDLYTHTYEFSIFNLELRIMLTTVSNNLPVNVPLRITKESLGVIVSNLYLHNQVPNPNEINDIIEVFPNVEPKYIPALFDLSIRYINQNPLILIMN
jgi:hypothetical protein